MNLRDTLEVALAAATGEDWPPSVIDSFLDSLQQHGYTVMEVPLTSQGRPHPLGFLQPGPEHGPWLGGQPCCGKPEPDALHDHCLRCHRNISQAVEDCPWCGPAPAPDAQRCEQARFTLTVTANGDDKDALIRHLENIAAYLGTFRALDDWAVSSGEGWNLRLDSAASESNRNGDVSDSEPCDKAASPQEAGGA